MTRHLEGSGKDIDPPDLISNTESLTELRGRNCLYWSFVLGAVVLAIARVRNRVRPMPAQFRL